MMMMAAADSVWTVMARIPWWAWIPIIAIIGGTVRSIFSINHKHKERMEMIRNGMDPRDYGKK
jgi:hypothetical protein